MIDPTMDRREALLASLAAGGVLHLPKSFFQRAERVLCEKSLLEFSRRAFEIIEPGQRFLENWHLELICAHLEAVSRGELKQDLVINVPPGHMKTLITSVFWPCWEWGPANLPWLRIMHCSYAPNNVTRDALRRREIIESEWFQQWWGDRVQLKRDQNTKLRYENREQGWMWGLTAGGAGTGEHPDRLIIDDPHDAEKVARESDRLRVLNWWRTKMASRGAGRGVRRVLVMQRLDFNDLAGEWLRRRKVVHICLPLRYEGPDRMPPTPLGWTDRRTQIGELLWPALFDDEKIRDSFDGLTPAAEAGQLQQRPPKQTAGADWPSDWFDDHRLFVRGMPARGSVPVCVLAIDPSLHNSEAADYCGFCVAMVDAEGKASLHMDLDRMDPVSLAHKVVQLYQEFLPHSVVIEGNGFQEVLQIPIQEECRRRGLAMPLRLVDHYTNKRQRILGALTMLWRRQEIVVDMGSPGARLFQEQCRAFPLGVHDDGPDVAAMAIDECRRLIHGDGEETEVSPY